MTFEALCKDIYGHTEKVLVDEAYVDMFDYDDVEDWCRHELMKSADFDFNKFDIINYMGIVEQASDALFKM